MDRIPVHNPGDAPMWVAGAMIPPGETRHFLAQDLPVDFGAPVEDAPAAPPEADPLEAILAGKVADVVAALPGLTDAELLRLYQIESASEKPRKGVLEAAAAEELARAQREVEGGEGGTQGAGGEGA